MGGPRFKASPVVKSLLKVCKETHTKWKENGSPGPDSAFYVKRKEAKQHLCRQLRKENYLKKETFYSELMQNPDTKTFYKLIKMNQSNRANSSTCFIVNRKSILDPVSQRMTLKNYYEDLAIPKDDIVFDDEYLQHSEMHIELIHELKRQGKFKPTEPFTEREIESSIKQLKTGKSADEYGLSAEHLKTSGEVIIPILKDIFNEVMHTGIVPDYLSGGVLTPVPKSGKDPTVLDNYRGITVTPIIGKLFEKLLLLRLQESVNVNQSELQFGFTKDLSPTMSSLICTEVINEARIEGKPLYLVTTDTQKAFDCVNHVILKKTLFEEGVAPDLWIIIDELYSRMSLMVKWQGECSESFAINQGVRQGGILSPHLYKMYVNPLLEDLKRNALGAHIGTIYTGCLAMADDFLFLSNCPEELQVMFNLGHGFSGECRYKIHPLKTTLVSRVSTKTSRIKDKDKKWYMGDKVVTESSKMEHLGILKSSKEENAINIQKRTSLARRTLYSLIKTGVHGCNGLNAKIAKSIRFM